MQTNAPKHKATELDPSIVFKKLEEYSVEYLECTLSEEELEEIRALREIVLSTMTPLLPSFTTAG